MTSNNCEMFFIVPAKRESVFISRFEFFAFIENYGSDGCAMQYDKIYHAHPDDITHVQALFNRYRPSGLW